MVKYMLETDWERAQRQLAAIATAIQAEGHIKVVREVAVVRRSLEDKHNPLQAGIELMALSEELAGSPDLWHRVVMLATELLEYPAVEKTARYRALASRPVSVDHFLS